MVLVLPIMSLKGVALSSELLINILIMGILGALGNYFIIKALSIGELSTLAPINSYKPNVTTHIIYDSKGKPIEQFYLSPKTAFESPFNEHTFFEYDKKGNLVRKNSQNKNMESGTITTTRTDYYPTGEIKETFTTKEFNGNKNSELITYAPDGKTIVSAKLSREKDNVIIVEEYSGENLENRFRHLPSRVTVYDRETNAIKSITVNQFDEEGILIGKVVEDKVKDVTMSYDYSVPNGIVESSFQGGVGNCFYLETVNSLNTTKNGKKVLSGTFGKEVVTDSEGNTKTQYKVAFGGASQIIEDLSSGIRNFPKDKIAIKTEYVITEDELKEACKKAGKDYSSGDKDVLLLELAFAKYRKDVVTTANLNEESTGLFAGNDLIAGLDYARGWGTDAESLDGGIVGLTMYLFTGKKSDVYMRTQESVPVCKVDADGNLSVVEGSSSMVNSKIFNMESNVYDKRYDNIDEVVDILSADTDEEGNFTTYSVELGLNITSQVVNGKVLTDGGHAFTVKGMKDGKVILINPWDSTKDAYMSLEDFKRATRILNFVQPPEING